MLLQNYPHDTWLADEDPSEVTIAWCKANDVKISTRKGCPDYHQPDWPRRTKCKEGNLAYFYDHYGYENYDIVCQLDADHVPSEGYLEEMLRPFADPGIGYVSAPSICDNNARESWSARGRLYADCLVHGALQAGYTGGWAPLCIGSHYAVRTAALRQIGGLGPELAEDHSTTLMMNAHGWRGIHAINAIAHGDGPRTFADLVTQEFQWSRSLTTILFKYSPDLLRLLPWRLKFQFAFCQLWYGVFSTVMLLTVALPVVALLASKNMVNVMFVDFIWRFALPSLIITLLALRWRRYGLIRPVDAKVLSWEGAIYLLARWPWWLIGTIAAVRDVLCESTVQFRVTPKGAGAAEPPSILVLAPYLLLSAVSTAALLLVDDAGLARGFYIFAALNASVYAGIALALLVLHKRESGTVLQGEPFFHSFGWKESVVSVMLVAALTCASLRVPQGVENFVWGVAQFEPIPVLIRGRWSFGPAVGAECLVPECTIHPAHSPRSQEELRLLINR